MSNPMVFDVIDGLGGLVGLEHLAQLQKLGGKRTKGFAPFRGKRVTRCRSGFDRLSSPRFLIQRQFFIKKPGCFGSYGFPFWLGMNDLQLRCFPQFTLQFFLRSGDRKHLIIKKFFDPKRYLYILSAITPLARTVLLRREHRELGFPISEHVRLHADKVANLADLEINFLRYYYSRMSHRR